MSSARAEQIVHLLERAFAERIKRDPESFRRRFRKMAADPFAFYRGAAPVYYADVADREDPWIDERLSRVWIHGDLHAENFGTYLDSRGLFVFDVNDFDESYLGHFTWDLMRCAASLALIGWRKALPDEVIDDLVARYVRAYLAQVRFYVSADSDLNWALRLDNTTGPVRRTLTIARAHRRGDLLDRDTLVVDGRRRFVERPGVRRLDGDERDRVLDAYQRYLRTVPQDKQVNPELALRVKDVVGRSGFGIGSAGLQAYNVLIEGSSQALEKGVWVVTDEIYEHLTYAGATAASMPVEVPELADTCVVVNGVAKTYAMTGWRVGWMIGPQDVVKAAANLQSHATSNVANVSQRAAIAAVSGDLSAVERMREAFDRRRRTIVAMLNEIDDFVCPEPKGAFYAYPSVGGALGREIGGTTPTTSGELAEVILDQAEVAVVPGEAFGTPGYLRMSYALGDDDLVEGVGRIQKLLG